MNIQKPELASLELAAVVKELQVLKDGKIDQVYQSEDYDFFMQVHTKEGRKLLRMKPGKFLYLTKYKVQMASPTQLCMKLRKHLNGGVIEKIEQIDSQRIIKIKTKDNELIVELFSQGNIILCDAENKIVGLLHTLTTRSRELKLGSSYKVPPLEVNVFSLNAEIFDGKMKESKKDKIVTSLATELGLGGLYAEEACARADIDKNKEPKELPGKERTELYKKIKEIVKEAKTPNGYMFEQGVIAPIILKNNKKTNEVQNFNEALDISLSKTKVELEKEKKEALYTQRISSLQRILSEQTGRLNEVEEEAEHATDKGNWLYEHYQEVSSLLDKVNEVKEKEGWKGVELFLKKLKKISKVDLKEKKVVVEIDDSERENMIG